jgi:hypothetical protein
VWPFQRKTEVPADSGPRPAPAPLIRRDWTGLPPIQRLIGAHPLTAPSDRFSDDLATHHDPSVSTEPMGHQVSAEAPAGIVLALARPSTRSDGPAMISRPRVQRRAQSAIPESGEWDGDEAASPATRSSPLPADMPAPAVRELPVVAPAPVAEPLTALSPDVEPMPVESRPHRSRSEHSPDLTAASRPDPAHEPEAAAPRLTLGQARRLGLGAPIRRVPDRVVQRVSSDPTEMPLASNPTPRPSPTRLEEEPSRAESAVPSPAEASNTQRLELPLAPRESTREPLAAQRTPHLDPPPQEGREISAEISAEPPTHGGTETFADAPTLGRTEISAKPASALVQRSLQTEPPPQGGLEISAEQALPLAMIQRTPHPDPPPQGGTEMSAEPALAHAMVERTPRAEPPGQGGSEISAESLPPSPPPRPFPARSEGVELAPLVGTRPLRPTTVQRTTEPAPVDLEELPSRGVGPVPAGVRIDRAPQAANSTAPVVVQAFPQGDDIVWPMSHDSAESAPTGSRLSQELTMVAPQRHYDQAAPDRELPIGRRFQAAAPSERAVSRAAALPLAPIQRVAAEAPPEPSGPAGESTPEVVQRGWFDSVASEVSSLSSRAPSAAEAGSAVSTVGSAIGSMFGGHKAAETDMDELAGKLYDKIRNRLKSELLVDRERAGFLTDLR